jgi:hypothetical protein
MKKLFILALMALTAVSADAQRKRTRTATSQGNFVVRAGLGFNYDKSDPDGPSSNTYTEFMFKPSVGYMVVDNLELGVNIGITNSNEENITVLTPSLQKTITKDNDINFGIYAQKYFPLNNWFAFTTSADLGLSTGSFKLDDYNASTVTSIKSGTGSKSGVGGALNFGIAFTPYNSFALQANVAGLGVQNTKRDTDEVGVGATNSTNFGFNVWRQAYSLDFVWYFGRGLWKN